MYSARALLATALTLTVCFTVGCDGCRQTAMKAWSKTYTPQGDPSKLRPTFDGLDASREHIPVQLHLVAEGFSEVTDLQFVPGQPDLLLVLQKGGTLSWVRLSSAARGILARIPVLTSSEEGLLGLAFHPRFEQNGRFYLNTVVSVGGKDTTQLTEWQVPTGVPLDRASPQTPASQQRVLLRLEQPYPNHNAGQLAFGPDGFLYIGFGDGGWKDDPLKAGQDRKNLLGKMLRVDVDHTLPGLEYAIPSDNPFVGRSDTRPEIFALGLRNPWRYSFAPDGRLIVADVGQNSWEEVSIVPAGANMGWSVREASHCFPPDSTCRAEGFTDPVYEYGREDGRSITGGYVYLGQKVPSLRGKYLFGDFVTGRIWALELPSTAGGKAKAAMSLGRWPLLLSTFGRDASGEVYVGDFGSGRIFRIEEARKTP